MGLGWLETEGVQALDLQFQPLQLDVEATVNDVVELSVEFAPEVDYTLDVNPVEELSYDIQFEEIDIEVVING